MKNIILKIKTFVYYFIFRKRIKKGFVKRFNSISIEKIN